MLKWLKRRAVPQPLLTEQVAAEEWRADRLHSLFLVISHQALGAPEDSERIDLKCSTFNSLHKVGFADGWTSIITNGPARDPELGGATTSRFISFHVDAVRGGVAQVEAKEVRAYDQLQRSDINATGVAFRVSLLEAALAAVTETARVGASAVLGDSPLIAFAIRIPVAERFVFPEPRTADDLYASGPSPEQIDPIACWSADWIEVAALDARRLFLNATSVDEPPANLFAGTGPVRLSRQKEK